MIYTTNGTRRVGVLIPTYNRQGMLRLALDSVLNQTCRDLEILVIDNGSSDGTAEYMATLSDPRLNYTVNEQNLGLIGSINRGIGLFSREVEWCTVLCDDDLLDTNFVAEMLSSRDTQAARSIVHSRRLLIDEAGKTIREAVYPPDEESALDYIVNRARGKRHTYLTGVFFSRQTFDSLGGYPQFTTGMASDDAFIFALAVQDRLVFSRGAIACVRIHEGAESLTASGSLKHLPALKEFSSYVETVARRSALYRPEELTSIANAVRDYVRLLNSSLWLRDAQATTLARNGQSGNQLLELSRLTRDTSYQFTTRVLLDSYCIEKFNYCPEKSCVYRRCWGVLEQIKNAVCG